MRMLLLGAGGKFGDEIVRLRCRGDDLSVLRIYYKNFCGLSAAIDAEEECSHRSWRQLTLHGPIKPVCPAAGLVVSEASRTAPQAYITQAVPLSQILRSFDGKHCVRRPVKIGFEITVARTARRGEAKRNH